MRLLVVFVISGNLKLASSRLLMSLFKLRQRAAFCLNKVKFLLGQSGTKIRSESEVTSAAFKKPHCMLFSADNMVGLHSCWLLARRLISQSPHAWSL